MTKREKLMQLLLLAQVSRKVGIAKDDASRTVDAGQTHHHGCDKEFSLSLQTLHEHNINFFTTLMFVRCDMELCVLKQIDTCLGSSNLNPCGKIKSA